MCKQYEMIFLGTKWLYLERSDRYHIVTWCDSAGEDSIMPKKEKLKKDSNVLSIRPQNLCFPHSTCNHSKHASLNTENPFFICSHPAAISRRRFGPHRNITIIAKPNSTRSCQPSSSGVLLFWPANGYKWAKWVISFSSHLGSRLLHDMLSYWPCDTCEW